MSNNERRPLSLQRGTEDTASKLEERLHKVLAQAGLGSRRALEQRIADGLVKVNGEVAQTGMSIKRYLLWAKIRRAVQLMADGGPLTQIALSGGFTDAAHMSRTFQRYFGLSPSFLANAGSVAVVVDEHALRTWQA